MLASSLFLLFVQKLARLLLCQRIRGSVKTNAKGNAKEISVPHRTAPGAAPPLSARAAGCGAAHACRAARAAPYRAARRPTPQRMHAPQQGAAHTS